MISKLEFIMLVILVKAFGISIRISLNSFIKGGKTSITDVRNIKVRNSKTIKRAIGRGILKKFFTLLHKLHVMLAITSEHIISKKKSLKLQKIRKNMPITKILKKSELFKFMK